MPFARNPLARLACAIATCAALVAPGAAQEGRDPDTILPPFRMRQGWNTQMGLPQGTVSAIVEDAFGFLWIGTFGGLVRFDGNQFEVFDQSRVPELLSNYISSLHFDREGTLWIGTAEGQLLHMRDGRFHAHDGEWDTRSGAVWMILELTDGRILACRNGRITAWRRSGRLSLPPELTALESVRWVHEDREGNLWIAAQAGVYRWDGKALELLGAPNGEPLGAAGWVGSFGTGDTVALTRRGLAWFRGDGVRIDASIKAEASPAAFCSQRLDDRTIMIASQPQLLVLHQAAERIEVDQFQPLSGIRTRSFHIDRHGQLWLGDTKLGLTCHARDGVRPMSSQFLRLDDGNKSFAASATGDPWVASTSSNRLHRLHPRTGACPITATLPESSDGKGVRGMVELGDRRLLVNAEGGLYLLSGADWTHIGEAVPGFQTPALLAGDGSAWIGGKGALVRVLGDRREDVGTAVGFPGSATIHSLAQSSDGHIWIGTQDALFCLAGGVLRSWTNADGLPVGQVRALLPLADGRLWIGTYGGGIACFDGTRIRKVAVDQGLMNNSVSRLDLDDSNRVWANTNLGAFSMRLEDLEAVASGERSFLSCYPARTGEAGGPSGVIVDGRDLVLPTVHGITLLDLGIVEPAAKPPGILITEFLANEAALDPRRSHHIEPGTRDLWFRFRGSDLLAANSLRYRFRLVGYDNEWQDANAETAARYTKVPPGEYRFEVQATNFRGLASPTAHVDFVLQHSLLERRWFQALIAFLAALLIVRGLTWRATRIRRHNRELSLEVELRKQAESAMRQLTHRLIRAQDEERSHVARELHDALGQRIALLAVKLDMLAQRDDSAPVIRGQLAGLSDRVQSIASEVHDISHRLHAAKLEQIGLVPAVRSLCMEFQRAHGLEVQFSHTGAASGLREGVSHGLYRIAQEALQNALRHSKAGTVGVHVAFRSKDVELVVRDDGIGFAPARGGEAGLGLTSMSERAGLLGGHLHIESEPGKGTVVAVSIPLSVGGAGTESAGAPPGYG